MFQSPPDDVEETSSTPEVDPIIMYSTTWCGACYRAKRVFDIVGVRYAEINIEEDSDAADIVMQINDGMRSVPTILFPDGAILVEPTNAQLTAKLVPYARQGPQED